MRQVAELIGLAAVVALTVWVADVASPDSTANVASARLLILNGSEVFTTEPDGSDRVDVISAESSQFLLPAWSPDGVSVAIPEISQNGDASLVVVTPGVGTVGVVPTPGPAFYLFWDPTSTSIAYLSQSPGLSLRLATPATNEDVELGQGAPFYLSWSAAGDAIVAHVGTDRFEEVALDGSRRTIGDQPPGRYRAPQWLPNNTYLTAIDDSGLDRLVVVDQNGLIIEEIAVYAGIGTFTMNPESGHIAYQFVLDPNDEFLSTQAGPAGSLVVTDLDSNDSEVLTDQTALGWWWSPDGDQLIFVTLSGRRDLPLKWHLWDGEETAELESFGPTVNFLRDFLPFFDQFDQSMTLWAADGSAFAYPGDGEDGTSGIWVHTIGVGPMLAADGTFVAWSPG